ncbi:hypothetical protein [Owenweeksia hongkongensis]|uniref:hypothetical protein n=1 Tax=Owenweeksia hongkongensis TaxID=253245 RepID=UPI003A8D6A21
MSKTPSNKFVPIKGNHAIEEVIFSVIFDDIIDPSNFTKNFAFEGFSEERKLITTQKITATFKDGSLDDQKSPPITIGFEILHNSKNDRDNPMSIIAFKNDLENERCYFNYHLSIYTDWETEVENFQKFVGHFSEVVETNPKINAFMLTYRDVFLWEGDKKEFDIKKAIKKGSEIFPKHYLDKSVARINAQSTYNQTDYQLDDIIEITFSDKVGFLRIHHSNIRSSDNFKEAKHSIESGRFRTFFDSAHMANKAVFTEIINQELIEQVGLLKTN